MRKSVKKTFKKNNIEKQHWTYFRKSYWGRRNKKTLDKFLEKLMRARKKIDLFEKKLTRATKETSVKNIAEKKYLYLLNFFCFFLYFYYLSKLTGVFSKIVNNPMRARGGKKTHVFIYNALPRSTAHVYQGMLPSKNKTLTQK